MAEEALAEDIISTDYEVGQDNVTFLGMDLHNPVFFISALLVLLFVAGTLYTPETAGAWLGASKAWAIEHFDWLFISSANIFVLFCLALIFLPESKIRIGGADAKPEFSTLSWLAMLFAAGMGIGLMFWSVAEPVGYFTDWHGTPLNVEAGTPAAASAAMGATMYHWGLHPWAIYAVVALALAYFAYNHDLPLTIRSAFYPLLGDRVWGWPGHLIDTLAVLATLFGLATSLGLGAKQAASGIAFLSDATAGLQLQLTIIAGVTAVAVISVIRGIDGGVKLLSNINMMIALLLLVFVTIAAFGFDIVPETLMTLGSYASAILPLSNPGGREDETFYHGWTVFYWAWWISWSPFVGMFIARISKGRTVREFMIAVLLVPTAITAIWMTAFGGAALHQVQQGEGALADGISKVSLAFFEMLQSLPFTTITSMLAVFLVLVFFVTSSDSGSLVIDSITSGGKLDAPVPQRVFWATMEGLVAGALLYGGGKQALEALQAGAISAGLPFTVLLLVMCVSLYKGMRQATA
ncbi:BCCT family transporter [Zhongshania sp.]|uniref:BCCT family transporter n=1 Tax=Zhongshania sp. TaxID=1971902 RepID=UPI003566D9C3